MGLDQVGSPQNDLTAQRVGDITSPDAGSINGQLAIIRGHIDLLETFIGDNTATPPANSLQERLAQLISSLAIAVSPVANSVQSRIQGIIDLIGAVPTPGGTTLQGRIQSILDAVGTIASPAVNSLQARIQLIADRIGDVVAPAAGTLIARIASLLAGLGAPGDAQATSDTGSFSAIALLKLIAARVNRANTTATLTSPLVAAAAGVLLTANGKGYKILNPGTNNAAILIREGGAPTAALYSYMVPPGYIYLDEYNYSGQVQAMLQTGTTSVNVMCTVH